MHYWNITVEESLCLSVMLAKPMRLVIRLGPFPLVNKGSLLSLARDVFMIHNDLVLLQLLLLLLLLRHDLNVNWFDRFVRTLVTGLRVYLLLLFLLLLLLLSCSLQSHLLMGKCLPQLLVMLDEVVQMAHIVGVASQLSVGNVFELLAQLERVLRLVAVEFGVRIQVRCHFPN